QTEVLRVELNALAHQVIRAFASTSQSLENVQEMVALGTTSDLVLYRAVIEQLVAFFHAKDGLFNIGAVQGFSVLAHCCPHALLVHKSTLATDFIHVLQMLPERLNQFHDHT